ncbi:response regulator [Desulfogranum mediterraneum]|uniref:response regulator n=1 Tax=Desulfogranum mediterraneum TaxID=160661 RepID=UPI00041DE43C|nr:response regulator [Desulfogranum mediterraneum]
MRAAALNTFYFASLKHKILFGFLFSILPMLVIVLISFFPARESALSSSRNQIGLISTSGSEKINGFFQSGANIFSEWTQEDVFGMAIEFEALDELKKHVTSLQSRHPEFHLVLITDANGIILAKNSSSHLNGQNIHLTTGSSVRETDLIISGQDRAVFLVDNNPIASSQSQARPSLLYSFRTSDSSGKANGYLLAYRELTALSANTESILLEMKRSGFMTSRVAVMNTASEKLIVFSGENISAGQQAFGPSLQPLLRQAMPGEISSISSERGSEQIVFMPLIMAPTTYRSFASAQDGSVLSLVISVEEEEIISRVNRTLMISVIIGAVALFAIIFIAFFTVRSITGPIGNLVEVLQRYASGDPTVRAEITSRDEIGYLSEEFNTMLEQINHSASSLQESESRYRLIFANLQQAVNAKEYAFRFNPGSTDDDLAISLNKMLETLETSDLRANREDWLKTGLTHLSEKISGEHKLADLCRIAITFIATYTGAQVGTIFVKEGDSLGSGDECFKLIASYAFRSRKGLANSYQKGEGLVGQAALEKKTIHFSDIPDDYIKIESSLGMTPPKNLLVIPLIYEGDVKGIIELGASFLFTPRYLDFSEQVGSVVAVAINAAMANDRLKELLEQTRRQSETLRNQQQELQKANAELEEQTAELKESEARLQVQQEELQASNEEMEEKNELLEEQKKENESKNRHLREKQEEIEEKARQLELATKYKSEFLSNMSHELRTPLNSILLLANLLAENEENNLNDDQVESATAIHRGGQTLLHLINEILDLSKIEAGQVELSLSATTPKTIATNFELEFNHLAKSKGLEFRTELGENLPESLITDEYRLEQIVRNLLGNAFKFTEKGSITLTIARPGAGTIISRKDLDPSHAVAISVTDTGPGIPADKLNLIFESFRQVDGSISRSHGGTGLGLSISRELAQLIGGHLTATSTLNQGAEFTLILPETLSRDEVQSVQARQQPLAPPGETEAAPTAQAEKVTEELVAAPASEGSSSGKSMLIIEDDKVFATILSNYFQKNGYQSIVADSGESGVKYAIEHKPTAVILDIGLPGIDGWTVLNELKKNPDTRHIPVHIMSAFDASGKGLQQGAVGYLTKPVGSQELRTALESIEYVLENEVKELLVVEDDATLRNNIMRLMETQDIHTTAAETGAQVMELLRSTRFDCMILDLGLPDISGFTLLDEIKKDASITPPPVIIYTGRDLTREETERLEQYSSTIVVKSAYSQERLLDETALFLHRVEQNMPDAHKKMIREVREKDSSIKGKKVLLVDDDMRNAFALNKFLTSKGVEVTIADNGRKALELLEKEQRPDIVLMDIMMPEMDGYEAITNIRKNKKFKELPILALTAKAMETDREKCISCGANDYLSKPIDTTKLLSMLRIWMY